MKAPAMTMQLCAVDRSPGAKPDLVLLHGWGSDSRIWQPLLPLLADCYAIHLLDLPGVGRNQAHNDWRDDARLLGSIAAIMPAKAHLMGWSLGGNLALEYTKHYPSRVLSLNLVATNPVFVQRSEWSCAMAERIFEQFYQRVKASPQAGLRRFRQLQLLGDRQARSLARALGAMYEKDFEYNPESLLGALSWLRSRDQRELLGCVVPAPRFLLGECDELVPVALADHLDDVRVLPGCSHIPMLSEPGLLAQWVLEALQKPAPAPGGKSRQAIRDAKQEKLRIARSFSNAAASYDAVASLQRAVGNELAELLPPTGQAGLALDLGCGTGHFLRQRHGVSNGLTWLGGDLAEGMLYHCKTTQPRLAGHLLGLDAESLPLADSSLDAIYSSLALQWCQDLDQLFAELRRVIRPGGWLAFSTLIDGTLHELKSAWQQVDGYVHVNHFCSEKDWLDAARGSGLRCLQWQQQTRLVHYRQLRDLMHELKALGAHNVNAGMASGLTGKRSWQTLSRAYEGYRCEGELPATWQVLYGVLIRD
jgi:malonyl-CoA O-methyltransferase